MTKEQNGTKKATEDKTTKEQKNNMKKNKMKKKQVTNIQTIKNKMTLKTKQ